MSPEKRVAVVEPGHSTRVFLDSGLLGQASASWGPLAVL